MGNRNTSPLTEECNKSGWMLLPKLPFTKWSSYGNPKIFVLNDRIVTIFSSCNYFFIYQFNINTHQWFVTNQIKRTVGKRQLGVLKRSKLVAMDTEIIDMLKPNILYIRLNWFPKVNVHHIFAFYYLSLIYLLV